MSQKEELDLSQAISTLAKLVAYAGRPLWAIVAALLALGFGAAGFVHKVDDLKMNGSDNFQKFSEKQEERDRASARLLTELTSAVKNINDQLLDQKERIKRLEDRNGSR